MEKHEERWLCCALLSGLCLRIRASQCAAPVLYTGAENRPGRVPYPVGDGLDHLAENSNSVAVWLALPFKYSSLCTVMSGFQKTWSSRNIPLYLRRVP